MDMKMCALMRQTWYESARRHLTDLERLAFYEACFLYEFTGEVPTEKTCKYSAVLLMFDMVKGDLERDREKAQKITERNRINGSLGGRPRKVYENPQEEENPEKPKETQENPTVKNLNPIHYTTLQLQTQAAAKGSGGGVFDIEFFDTHLWPRLNASGKFNSRHRACAAMWATFTELKRGAIVKAVMSDLFVGATNPYFYLADFEEPSPKYLSGKECESEWQAGRDVYLIKTIEGTFKPVTAADVQIFGLKPERKMQPAM